MKIINASTEILTPLSDMDVLKMYQFIEKAGRTCYKSTSTQSPNAFVRNLVKRGHEAMIEHASVTVKFIVDRGVSHEIVRHRLASFAQESTRYCNYSQDKFGNELTFIKPCFIDEDDVPQSPWDIWRGTMEKIEEAYIELVSTGELTPEEARCLLPNSLKTELIVTMNMREWRHFFKLRAAGVTGKPHPQMIEVAVPLLKQFQERMPELFGDIEVQADG